MEFVDYGYHIPSISTVLFSHRHTSGLAGHVLTVLNAVEQTCFLERSFVARSGVAAIQVPLSESTDGILGIGLLLEVTEEICTY